MPGNNLPPTAICSIFKTGLSTSISLTERLETGSALTGADGETRLDLLSGSTWSSQARQTNEIRCHCVPTVPVGFPGQPSHRRTARSLRNVYQKPKMGNDNREMCGSIVPRKYCCTTFIASEGCLNFATVRSLYGAPFVVLQISFFLRTFMVGPVKLPQRVVPPSKSHFFLTYPADIGFNCSSLSLRTPGNYSDGPGLHSHIIFVPERGEGAWEITTFPRLDSGFLRPPSRRKNY